ncbi:helix-turn-helix domain-containing protein [Enterococcus lactis]|uniref:helix-turn-helix domain-containing protein n=1 Tax=Enterococcus lactis TaxID=357441 RepID=UPI00376F8E43
MFQRIRDLREDNDLTQQQIAKLLNVSQSTYSRYENGELDIPMKTVIKLTHYYNTSVDYLVNMTNIKTPYKRN